MSDSKVPLNMFGWLADVQGCGTYRILQPFQALNKKHKIESEAGGKSSRPYTLLVAQRAHKPEVIDFMNYLVTERPGGYPKVVYEIDDDLWSIEKHNPGYAYYKSENVLENAVRAIELSDAVTVSTEPLAEIVRNYNENVYVLPNSIPKKYINEIRYPYSVKQEFVMAWSGGHTHDQDVKQIMRAVQTVLMMYPNARMVFFGTDYSRMLDSRVHSQVRVAPWIDSVDKYQDFVGRAGVDVMLAPLSPSKFNESKSNLRIIEANAFGIPVIATEFGPYVCDSPGVMYAGDSWTHAITELMNPFRRLEMSSGGRDWVRSNFCQEETVDLWLNAYNSILEG